MRYWDDSAYVAFYAARPVKADNLLARALLAESLFGWMRFS